MKIMCIIPSRLGSTRLLRKPLLSIQGKPMIQRVYENAKKCLFIDEVLVATDSEEIAGLISDKGGNVILTPENIATGSDRVALVAKEFPEMDVIINLQGDEPFINATMLEELVSPYLKGERPDMTTLACPLDMATEYHNPAVVKVILNDEQNAIYFSRSPIPYFSDNYFNDKKLPVYHHIGLYAFTRDALLKVYDTLPRSPLEQAEGLEQLRVLAYGYKIRVCFTSQKTLQINTPLEFELAQHFACEVIG
jgi:3-deoxy-manno-octulosonate cytidylyltransferase (CMP-KDO synthetase)